VAFERDRDDLFARYLMPFIGLGTEGLRNRTSVPDEALVFYTGLLSLQPRSATHCAPCCTTTSEFPWKSSSS
jgi:predicted component of type VI protein secretion system